MSIQEANLPRPWPLGCMPRTFNHLGTVDELTFEANPGCNPEPSPNNGDYYIISAIDDGLICGQPIEADGWMIWNNEEWYSCTAEQAARFFPDLPQPYPYE